MAEITLHPMTREDLGPVGRIYASRVGEPPPPEWDRRVVELIEAQGPAAVFVARRSDQLVGYVVGEVRSWEFGSAPAGWIFGIGVAEGSVRQGIARALLTHAVAALRDAGVTSIRTMTRRDDVAVLRLFRSAGFAAGPYTQLELES